MFGINRTFKNLIIILFFLAANLLLYVNKMPLYHEEPRRIIIANEMLLKGNYIVPTVCGENYLKKPPLQNWVILLLAKMNGGKITNFIGRLPSVFSYLITGLLLFFLFEDRKQGFVASLIFLTSYVTLISYANKAEPDIMFTSFVFLSYYFWVKSDRLDYFVTSAIFMGLGILTKGIAPVFFYPGIFFYYLIKKKNIFKKTLTLFAHFLISLIIPICWFTLYAYEADITSLLSVFSNEVSSRMIASFSYVVFHFIVFPVKAILALFPWSVVFLFIFNKRLWIELKDNKLFITSFLMFLSSFVILTIFPGGRGRYFMPAVPFFAVTLSFLCPKAYLLKDKIKWSAIVLLAIIYYLFAYYVILHGFVFQGVVLVILGLVLLYFGKFKYYVFDFLVVFSIFLFLFYIHGLYLYRANTKKNYIKIAKTVYHLLPDKKLPIVVDNTLKPEFVSLALNIERLTGEFVYSENVIHPEKFYLITMKEKPCKLIYRCHCSKRVPSLKVYLCNTLKKIKN